MTLNRQAVIFTEKNNKIGYGHFNRSKILCDFLIENNFEIKLIALTSIDEINNYNFKEQIILIDTPSFSEILIEKAAEKSIISIAFDYFGDNIPDYNILIFPHSTPKSKISTYIGYDYIIFNNNLSSLQSINSNENYILICLGGADVNGQSIEIAQKLLKQNIDFKVILGPLAHMPDKKQPFEIYQNPKNFIDLVLKSKTIICNGGNTLFESILLKKSIYVVPQTKMERKIASDLYKKSYIKGYSKGDFNFDLFQLAMKNKVSFENCDIDFNGKKRILNILKKI